MGIPDLVKDAGSGIVRSLGLQCQAMSTDDDASYKLLFSAPEVVRDLVLGFIPDEWLHSLEIGRAHV